MIRYSIVFSARNRAKELSLSLPSIFNKYKNREDIEIVCMDDHSSDGTKEVISNIASQFNSPKLKLFDSTRSSTDYDLTQADQTNFLVDNSSGEYILHQSAEILHVDNIIDQLSRYCLHRQPSFATVYNTIGEGLDRLLGEKTFVPPLHGSHSPTRPEAMIFRGLGSEWPAGQDVQFPDGKSMAFVEYTGYHRNWPLFFCGMIMKEDWIALGGYKKQLPTDIHFLLEMDKNEYRFAFCSCLAIHITHGKT